MGVRRFLRTAAEILVFVLALGLFDGLWPGDPAFQSLAALPYFAVPVIFGAAYGWAGALGGWAAAGVAVGISAALGGAVDPSRVVPGALAGIYLSGAALFIRRLFFLQQNTYRQRFRDLVAKNHRLTKENLALVEICRAAENRIALDRRSLSFLVTRLGALDQGSLRSALEGMLSLVQTFVGAEKATVWKYDPAGKRLLLAAALGWSGGDWQGTELPAEGSIPGWVCRNGTPFSLRMVVDQEHFAKMDRGNSLIAYPVKIADRIWGVLNIEALPFVNYSRHAEDMVDVILKLAEKSLKPLLDREELFTRQETDLATGLPQASLFLQVLEEESHRAAQRGGSLSVVILELANGHDLEESAGRAEVSRLLARIAAFLGTSLGAGVDLFLYKRAHQLAFYLIDRDRDGTALACLGLLAGIQSQPWVCGTREVPLEILIGYGTLASGATDPTPMLEAAERLLGMQRI